MGEHAACPSAFLKEKSMSRFLNSLTRSSSAASPGQKLFGSDRIRMVAFHTAAFVIARPAEPFAAWLLEHSQKLHEKIDGGTNIAAGIRLGTQLLRQSP